VIGDSARLLAFGQPFWHWLLLSFVLELVRREPRLSILPVDRCGRHALHLVFELWVAGRPKKQQPPLVLDHVGVDRVCEVLILVVGQDIDDVRRLGMKG